jgi:threonine/homoserine/homoserine lactone efflux protein
VSSSLLTLATIGFVQLLAVISPGPSFLITARTAVAHSRAAGIKVALGLGAGTVIWSSAALLGLNFLFRQFHWLFVAMKIGGALFLIWIAIQIFRHAAVPIDMDLPKGSDGQRGAFMRGFWTQLSNPKVAVFFGSIFVAMLPNEIAPWMIAALITIVTLNEIAWYSFVALFFGSPPVRRAYLGAKRWIDRVTGLFLGALGLRLVWHAGDAAA